MSNITANTDFIGRFYVANNVESESVAAQLTYLISTYEELFLRSLLGPYYYQLFVDWYAKNEENRLLDPNNETFAGLLAGVTFENRQSVLVYSKPIKQSIMGYLYDRWNRENLTQTVAMGEVKTDSQNATTGAATYKVVDRWNEMATNVRLMWQWLDKQLDSQTQWQDWCKQDNGGRALYFYWYYPDRDIFKMINRLDL